MWPDDRLTRLLGIEHPIIQAPMAGTTTPALVAAIANAGGMGSHGCAALSPETLERDMTEMRAATNGAVNLNFFCHAKPEMSEAAHSDLLAELAPDYQRAGANPPSNMPEVASPRAFGPAELALLLAHPPAVASFHFGLPDPDAIAALKTAGCKILASATTVAEARWLAERGADAIIAQGWEAGGHRGVFLDVENDAQVGLFALLPQIVDAVAVPVIAAGGIADGRGIAAAFALGASGVQIGTAFIDCAEAAQRDWHIAALQEGHDDSTMISSAVSGRPARAHRTPWLTRMKDVTSAPFPLMYHYTRPLQAADPEPHHFALYGQSAALRPAGSARDRFDQLVTDAQKALVPAG
ncbi:NAD(P)H-dependent flavin oxidoreductase [Lutimaribacter marinistellae]|uniref:Propionate 3-nitronate monooxygenase n=1 Tax=Lutimaribacter marinistellae TaxID=1820329 RepID=A0ABV7TJJ2_9RHOB